MEKIINSISPGDLLVYCPDDLEEKRHDVGIIYSIEETYLSSQIKTKIKKFKIFWNRSHLHDEYSETTLIRKLNKYVILVKQNEK